MADIKQSRHYLLGPTLAGGLMANGLNSQGNILSSPGSKEQHFITSPSPVSQESQAYLTAGILACFTNWPRLYLLF
jgi:hypothetical protein